MHQSVYWMQNVGLLQSPVNKKNAPNGAFFFIPHPAPVSPADCVPEILSLRAQRGNPVNKSVRRRRTKSIIYALKNGALPRFYHSLILFSGATYNRSCGVIPNASYHAVICGNMPFTRLFANECSSILVRRNYSSLRIFCAQDVAYAIKKRWSAVYPSTSFDANPKFLYAVNDTVIPP